MTYNCFIDACFLAEKYTLAQHYADADFFQSCLIQKSSTIDFHELGYCATLLMLDRFVRKAVNTNKLTDFPVTQLTLIIGQQQGHGVLGDACERYARFHGLTANYHASNRGRMVIDLPSDVQFKDGWPEIKEIPYFADAFDLSLMTSPCSSPQYRSQLTSSKQRTGLSKVESGVASRPVRSASNAWVSGNTVSHLLSGNSSKLLGKAVFNNKTQEPNQLPTQPISKTDLGYAEAKNKKSAWVSGNTVSHLLSGSSSKLLSKDVLNNIAEMPKPS